MIAASDEARTLAAGRFLEPEITVTKTTMTVPIFGGKSTRQDCESEARTGARLTRLAPQQLFQRATERHGRADLEDAVGADAGFAVGSAEHLCEHTCGFS